LTNAYKKAFYKLFFRYLRISNKQKLFQVKIAHLVYRNQRVDFNFREGNIPCFGLANFGCDFGAIFWQLFIIIKNDANYPGKILTPARPR